MPVVRTGSESEYDMPFGHFARLAAPSLGSESSVVYRLTMRPGMPADQHVLTRGEVLVVLSGAATARIGDSAEKVGPADTVIVPAGVPFAISPNGDEDLVALCVVPVGGQVDIPGAEPFTAPWTV
jgi:quercetin dioxygenase-like cupin family protein